MAISPQDQATLSQIFGSTNSPQSSTSPTSGNQATLDQIFGNTSTQNTPAPTATPSPSLPTSSGTVQPSIPPSTSPTTPLPPSNPNGSYVDPGSQFGPAQLSNFEDLGKGAIKGALNTANNVSQWGQNLFRPINNAVLGIGGKQQPTTQSLPQNLTTPSNTAQQVGYGGEQLAEFMLPMGAASEATDAAKAAIEGSELSGGAKLAAKVATRAGIGALEGGSVAAAQQGGINDNVLGTAALSGAIPGIQEALEPFLTKILPSRLLNSLIKPGTKDFTFGKNPGLALANEGIVAPTLSGLQEGIASKMNEIGSQIGNVAQQTADAGGTHDVTDFIKKYQAKALTALPTDAERSVWNSRIQSLFSQFKDAGNGQIAQALDADGNPIMKDLTNVPSDQFHQIQTQVGKLAKWTGEAGEKGVNKLFKGMYGDMGSELDQTAQQLTGQSTKDLQTRWSNLLGAQNAVENRMGVATRNALMGVRASIAAGAGYTQGNNLEDKLKNALLSGLGEKFIESTIGSPLLKSGLGASLVDAGESQLPKLVGPVTSVLSNPKVTSNKDMSGLNQIFNNSSQTPNNGGKPSLDQIFSSSPISQ